MSKRKEVAQKNVLEKRDEFRTNKGTGHPSYIYAKVGNKYKFIGITHSDVTQGMKNIPLDVNPNPNDKQKRMRVLFLKKIK